jgi:hypothetical protein
MTFWQKQRLREQFLPGVPFHVAREGEGGEGGENGGGEGGEGGENGGGEGGENGGGEGGDDKNKKKKPPTFTKEQQDYFNAQLAEERRRGKEKNDKLILELQTKSQLVSTSEAEKKRIEDQIEQLRGEYLTKEENQKKSVEKQLKDEREKREKAEKTAKDWETLYTEEKIERDLTDAAVEHKAFNPEPVRAVLRPQTRITDELDNEGKPTGKKVTRVKVKKPGENGTVQIMEMTPAEAVKHMTEIPDSYGNLFNSGANGGLGGNNFSRQSGGDGKAAIPKGTKEYMAKRAELKKQGVL